MDEVLLGVLAENIDRYLDAADDGQSAHPEEHRRMVAAWRALLAQHKPTGRWGRCAACAEAHPRRGMCTVWRVAAAFFIRGRN